MLQIEVEMHFRADERTQLTSCDTEMNGEPFVADGDLVSVAAIAPIAG